MDGTGLAEAPPNSGRLRGRASLASMTSPALPLPQDLMLPTLRATANLGGVAQYQEIDQAAVLIAGITEDQMAVEFGEDSTAAGPKVLHRAAWARSMLKRIGALESAGYGRWATTLLGLEIAALPDDEATAQIEMAVAVGYREKAPDGQKLQEFRDRARDGDPVTLTVRELISLWGVNRRRSGAVERVINTLEASGLRTDPDFAVGSLDAVVALVALTTDEILPESAPTAVTSEDLKPPTLVVGNVPSAMNGVTAVNRHDSLLVAQSQMEAHDYSQLAVMEGEFKLVGAVSWESIAKALSRSPAAALEDCIDRSAIAVSSGEPLLDTAPAISKAGFVFVRSPNNRVVGIVTTADLTDQFALLTKPFLLLGEIEGILRTAVNRRFSSEDLLEATDPDDDRVVDGAESLTLGEIQRFLSQPSTFERIGWRADRKVFHHKMESVRRIRNEVMHFSPDPLDEQDVRLLQTFLQWLGALER